MASGIRLESCPLCGADVVDGQGNGVLADHLPRCPRRSEVP